jgi:hypothetical protein
VEIHGTLTAVAWAFLDRTQQPHDAASVERALRRLRGRGQHEGGTWESRLLRVFGLPISVEAQVRWMGLYHSPFRICRSRSASVSYAVGSSTHRDIACPTLDPSGAGKLQPP